MLCRVAENCCVVLLKMRLFRGKAANRQSQVRRPVREEFDADLAIQKMMTSGHWPRREYMRGASVMSPSENKTHWSASAEVAARRGTWTHLQCKCVLNGGSVDGVCPELALLAIFLGRTKPHSLHFAPSGASGRQRKKWQAASILPPSTRKATWCFLACKPKCQIPRA